jgi:hypothetical protein
MMTSSLDKIAREIRHRLIRLSREAQSAHLAGALSYVDILVALYWEIVRIDPKNPADPLRDRVVFSKGHAVSALYAILAKKGFLPEEKLDRYNQPGAGLPEQPCPGLTPGVEWATGSLGHGLVPSSRTQSKTKEPPSSRMTTTGTTALPQARRFCGRKRNWALAKCPNFPLAREAVAKYYTS